MKRPIAWTLPHWTLAFWLLGCGVDSSAKPSAMVESALAAATEAPIGPYVRVLGTMQDGGLPHPGCTCARCELALRDPEAKRYVTSIALVVPATRQVFLFDATPDLGHQLVLLRDIHPAPLGRVDRSPVDGVFLTHAHIGHYLGLAYFGYEALNSSGVSVFSTPRMAAFLRHNGPWSQLVDRENIRLEEILPGDEIEIAPTVKVKAFSAPHRDEYADTLGYVLRGPERSLVYLPDTDSWEAWSSPVADFLSDVDVALIDGTFFSADELPGRSVESIGHPLITTTMDLLGEWIGRSETKVYFTHLNHSNAALERDGASLREIESRGFEVLEEGDRFDL